MIASAFRPEIADALAVADEKVRAWLAPADTWRKDADGLPLEEDVIVSLSRLRGGGVDLRVSFERLEYTVNYCDSRDEFSATTLPEALLLLLADDLKRTCVECREYDGHDVRCSVLVPDIEREEDQP